MNALELMEACRKDVQERERLKERIGELDFAITSFPTAFCEIRKGSATDKIADFVARKDELTRNLMQTEDAIAVGILAVFLITEELPETQRKTVSGYYCYGKSALSIAQELNCTVRNIRNALKLARASMALVDEKKVEAALPAWYIEKHNCDDEL